MRVTNNWRDRQNLTKELVSAARRVYELGYVTSSGGNLSCRLGPERLLITPTGRSKGDLREEEMVTIDLEGTVVRSRRESRPSSEAPSHAIVYRLRSDVAAVVHAHPPVLTGFALADASVLVKPLHPEVAIEIGPIASIEYVEPAGGVLASALQEVIQLTNTVLLGNHGVIVCSQIGIAHAVELLQLVEVYAYSCWIALTGFGRVNELSNDDLDRLDRIRRERGVPLPGFPGRHKDLRGLYERLA